MLRVKKVIAKILLFLGTKPGYSTNILGQITSGYGSLDVYGFWQFPLSDGEILKGENRC